MTGGLIAHCVDTDADTPDDCTGWEFLGQANGEYMWTLDPNVEVTAGRCPQVKTNIYPYIHEAHI